MKRQPEEFAMFKTWLATCPPHLAARARQCGFLIDALNLSGHSAESRANLQSYLAHNLAMLEAAKARFAVN